MDVSLKKTVYYQLTGNSELLSEPENKKCPNLDDFYSLYNFIGKF